MGEAAASLITSLVTALFSCADDIWTTAIVLAEKIAQGIAEKSRNQGGYQACFKNVFKRLRIASQLT